MHKTWTVPVLIAGLTSITLAQIPIPPNISVTGPLPDLQNEEQVWICPTDTSMIVTNHRDFRLGFRQIGLGRSTNGGLSWVDTLIAPSFQIFTHQSDPVMTVNSSGDIIINHLDYRRGIFPRDSSHLAFMVSTDCGATWTGPTTVVDTVGPYFEDKQFIASDRTGGAHDGNVYISWTRFDNPTRIIFARSTNNTASFDDTIVVGPTITSTCFGGPSDAGQFSQPLVGKDGSVYVFWQGRHIDSVGTCGFFTAIRYNKSTDGGVSWLGDRALVYPVNGWGAVDGGVNVYSQPTTEADITNGPHAGNIYVQYRDVNLDSPFLDSDIYCMRSLDTGATWSNRIRVNDDPLGPDVDQFHNWLVTNEEGVLASIWYDQRTDPSHFKFDVFAAYSFDGGETWSSSHRISDVSIDPAVLASARAKAYLLEGTSPPPPNAGPLTTIAPQAGLIAEYIGLSCVGDKLVAIWTDTRFGGQDVMSATWQMPLTDPRLLQPADGDTLSCAAGLDWSTAWKESSVSYRLQIDNDPGFATPEIDTMLTDNQFGYSMPNGLAVGTWNWRLKAYDTGLDSTAFSSGSEFYLTVDCACDSLTGPDTDGDGVPDACDICPGSDDLVDTDGDSVPDGCDVCAGFDDLADADGDSVPDGCDICAGFDDLADADGDSVPDGCDICAGFDDALDADGDLIANGCDNCSDVFNPGQEDADSNGVGDACEFVCPIVATGDVDTTGTLTSADVISMVNYVFKNGPDPAPCAAAGDVNCDAAVTSSDVIYMVNHVFKSGALPCDVCTMIPAEWSCP